MSPSRFLSLAVLLCPLLLSTGCPSDGPGIKDDTADIASVDADGDGYTTDEDCDDADPSVHPGAQEECDDLDNDCDGEVDEGTDTTYYGDVDGDGYGDPEITIQDCEPPSGYVTNADDCDDSDATQHPGADEYCNGEDDDCDDEIDEDALDSPSWYGDNDGDGYGVPDDTAEACEAPSGYVATDDDCDDENATVYPGADEYCNGIDDDCDGEIDEDTVDAETNWYPDSDGDGYGDPGEVVVQCTQPKGYVLDFTDCDDGDASVNPGATEYCDGMDNDCDRDIDEDDADDAPTWYADTDGDGFGDAATSIDACYQPSGYVSDDTDCDDADAMQYPGAYEVCNGEDDDCDGDVDEDTAIDASTWYADTDGDGFGDASSADVDCDQPTGYVADDTDCDDTDAAVNPAANEICNGIDDDCDGVVDEDDATDVATWYADRDGDGYGDATTTREQCDQPTNYVADDSDCDDTDATQYPGADEWCNGEDDDCDGLTDEDDANDVIVWYEDADGDGFGNDAVTDIDCEQPSGYAALGGDCDDTDPAYNPGASETDCTDPADYNCDGSVAYADADGDGWAACEDCDDSDANQHPSADERCNGEDDDCDGDIDEDDAVDVATWYADTDGDGFGDASVADIDCDQPTGFVADDTDCDDTVSTTHPGAIEYCDGVDNDCDGTIDEDSAFDVSSWYADNDADGYGDPGTMDIDCDQPPGYVADNTDCDDTDTTQYPGATERCNGEDDDCDGDIDEDDASDVSSWYADYDEDGYGDASRSDIDCDQPSGYVADSSDCDDTDADVHPGADEWCNGIDDDCDGDIDEDDAVDVATWYADDDDDGFGDPGDTEIDCDQPSGYVADSSDCDDTEADVHPGADEWCNGIDDDCDGDLDEDNAVDVATWYADDDGDSYGDALDTDVDCDQPTGYVADDTDCDDTEADVNPAAAEICNGIDDDCDGTIDEDDATDVVTWYADDDGDGFGDATTTDIDCDQPTGYVADSTDCDDTDADVHPGADEHCNGIDDDCDGTTDEDEAVDASTWYADADGDGHGAPADTASACDQPSGYVDNDTDCDDTNADLYPGADEWCNDIDDDCDGLVDEDDAMDVVTWYADDDGDSYGDPGDTSIDCDQPSGYVADDTDCDDSDAAINPGVDELCNAIDDDCDGTIDEDDAVDASTWYADTDGDGYGDADSFDIDCYQPSGYVADDTDCDDVDADIYPGADELCDGMDNDCDGTVDEDDALDVSTWYADSDGDGYGDASTTSAACDQPTGHVADATDCDDTDADVNPDATEHCNGIDDDCDGSIDEDDAVDVTTWYADSDGDGYGEASSADLACDQPSGYVADDTDCDDTDANQYPGADEWCNGEDDDCDGDVDEDGEVLDGDEYYADVDGDGTGDPSNTIDACDLPSGYADNDWDCDDHNATEPVVVDAASGSSAGAGTLADPLDTVQAGVNQAGVCAIVLAGTYNEAVTLSGMEIELAGVEGADSTIIDATGLGDAALTINSGETAATVITGFTLLGDGHLDITSTSYACTSVTTCTDWYYSYCGGGAHVMSSDPTFRSVKAVGSALPLASTVSSGDDTTYTSSFGGGMCFLDSTSSVSDSEISSNFADQGGGVYADETSSIAIDTTQVAGNTATDGAGFEIEGGSLSGSNLVTLFNDADGEGGGLYLIDGEADLVNVSCVADDAPSGAGLYASGSSTLTLSNGIVHGATSGEGILVDAGASFTGTYNDVQGSAGADYSGVTDPTGSDGNISVVPSFTSVTDDGNLDNDDLSLASGSPCIDAGDPSSAYDDADGTRNDMGAYGGPAGSWP